LLTTYCSRLVGSSAVYLSDEVEPVGTRSFRGGRLPWASTGVGVIAALTGETIMARAIKIANILIVLDFISIPPKL